MCSAISTKTTPESFKSLIQAQGKGKNESQRGGSNPRPADYESAALPAELRWLTNKAIGQIENNGFSRNCQYGSPARYWPEEERSLTISEDGPQIAWRNVPSQDVKSLAPLAGEPVAAIPQEHFAPSVVIRDKDQKDPNKHDEIELADSPA